MSIVPGDDALLRALPFGIMVCQDLDTLWELYETDLLYGTHVWNGKQWSSPPFEKALEYLVHVKAEYELGAAEDEDNAKEEQKANKRVSWQSNTNTYYY